MEKDKPPAVMFCPDCQTNLDDVPANDPRPTAGVADVQASSSSVGVSVGMADSAFWLEQWLRVEKALALLRAAYEPGANVSSTVEVDLRVRSFFTECHHFGDDWIEKDLDNWPGIESAQGEDHIKNSQALSACEAICNKAKHAERSKPKSSTGRVLTIDSRPNGSHRVRLRVDWHPESEYWHPESEWAYECPWCPDALELAEDCVASWREFLAAAEVARRSDGDPVTIAERIARLPDREKRVVSLYYYDRLNMREIGEVLGVTESRVSQLLKKAITTLRGASA